jgi:hypothetical protein
MGHGCEARGEADRADGRPIANNANITHFRILSSAPRFGEPYWGR